MYFLYILLNKVVEQVVGGSVINGATMYKVYNTIYNIQYGDLYKGWINQDTTYLKTIKDVPTLLENTK